MTHVACFKDSKMFLSNDQRTFLVKRYLETNDTDVVLREFQNRFHGRQLPNKKTILRNVIKFERNGTIQNLHKGNSGRRRTGRTRANVDAVTNLLENGNQVSCRRNMLGLPSSTFNRIVRLDLKWHPYKVHLRHQLQAGDYARRLRFAHWFRNACRNNRFLFNAVVGDEASFGMNGKVSTQNVRMYAPKGEPPAHNFDRRNDRRKVNVWAAICGNGTILGPYFFDGNVNGRRYLDMINNFAVPGLGRSYGVNIGDNAAHHLLWIQDGATCHRTIPVRQRISQVFGQRVVALGHDVEWPARSPDLTPCDFFLWGHIKQKVFATPPDSVENLRERITNAVNNLRQNPEFIRNSMREMQRRAQKCIDNQGQHVEGH